MKLWPWLDATSRRTSERTVTVDIELDTSKFVAAMLQAAETTGTMRYRQRVQLERFKGFCYVRGRALELCVALGLDPADVFTDAGVSD